MRPFIMLCLAIATLNLSGCASSAIGTVASLVMQASGIGKPDVPDSQKPPRNVSIKLHASANLNAGNTLRPAALIAKIYKLKQNASFQRATYDTFLSSQKEKEVLGTDLLDVREVTLIPGQRYEVPEKVTKEAGFIGIVFLFQNPAAQRWKVSFQAEQAEKSGITLGVHACGFTLGAGAPIEGEDSVSMQRLLVPAACR